MKTLIDQARLDVTAYRRICHKRYKLFRTRKARENRGKILGVINRAIRSSTELGHDQPLLSAYTHILDTFPTFWRKKSSLRDILQNTFHKINSGEIKTRRPIYKKLAIENTDLKRRNKQLKIVVNKLVRQTKELLHQITELGIQNEEITQVHKNLKVTAQAQKEQNVFLVGSLKELHLALQGRELNIQRTPPLPINSGQKGRASSTSRMFTPQ